jgi:extradiol dioxygenase family protein
MRHGTKRGGGSLTFGVREIGTLIALLGLALVWSAGVSRAQLSSPNTAGVAMGHLHYHVLNVEANKKFWATLGAKPIMVGSTDVMKLPDVLIFLTKGEPYAGMADSVVNHVAFKMPNLDQALATLRDAGWTVRGNDTYTPQGDRVELFQELTENARFIRDDKQVDFTAERLNRKMTVPIATHHIHLYGPAGHEMEVRDWYAKICGGIPGRRGIGRYVAVDLPGMNVNFLGIHTAVAPTKGRSLDHIGFEVKNLEAFCKKLEASGVKFDMPYTKQPGGFAAAFLIDPWGTYIELTEGLGYL